MLGVCFFIAELAYFHHSAIHLTPVMCYYILFSSVFVQVKLQLKRQRHVLT